MTLRCRRPASGGLAGREPLRKICVCLAVDGTKDAVPGLLRR